MEGQVLGAALKLSLGVSAPHVNVLGFSPDTLPVLASC